MVTLYPFKVSANGPLSPEMVARNQNILYSINIQYLKSRTLSNTILFGPIRSHSEPFGPVRYQIRQLRQYLTSRLVTNGTLRIRFYMA